MNDGNEIIQSGVETDVYMYPSVKNFQKKETGMEEIFALIPLRAFRIPSEWQTC